MNSGLPLGIRNRSSGLPVSLPRISLSGMLGTSNSLSARVAVGSSILSFSRLTTLPSQPYDNYDNSRDALWAGLG
jgi:hypothetical protein